MAEQLLFSQAAESLQRALGPLLTAETKARFRELGLDYDKPLLPAYPLREWRRVAPAQSISW